VLLLKIDVQTNQLIALPINSKEGSCAKSTTEMRFYYSLFSSIRLRALPLKTPETPDPPEQ